MTSTQKSKAMENIPNILTVARIFAVPIVAVLMMFQGPGPRAWAALIFVLASITDYLDGYLARKYEVISTVGKLLDPMADKLLVMSALIMLIPEGPGSVPAWAVLVILGRDIMVTSLRSVASAEGVVIQAEELGKFKTILQILALTGLILGYPYGPIDFSLGGMYFFWASVIVSVWSGLDYFHKFWFAIARK